MISDNINEYFDRITYIAKEMDQHAPSSKSNSLEFRSDLAGLLVVAIAANYENCIKETLFGYAARHGNAFAQYAEAKYAKLNSRISHNDLKRYTKIFDPLICKKFNCLLRKRKLKFRSLARQDILTNYEQILQWRHAYAHAGTRSTTIEEAMATHRVGKWVVISFFDAFQPR